MYFFVTYLLLNACNFLFVKLEPRTILLETRFLAHVAIQISRIVFLSLGSQTANWCP